MSGLSGLFTDFYELTMMQGYFLSGYNPRAVFEMFYRKHPFDGGYTVFAGLETLLHHLQNIRFSSEDLDYLESTGVFRKPFLDYLSSLHFSGDVYAFQEGEVVFAGEPLVRVDAPLIEAQWIESLVLNTLNFQTLIATKTRRIRSAAGEKPVLEFGLRRAHGPDGALSGTRAAYIGGADATSNVLGGREFDIPVKGTMAHSWIMSFRDEYRAFRRYGEIYPEGCILLVDTYDTVDSGLKNAIKTAKDLDLGDSPGFGVRLDSGDPAVLCRKVRSILDREGFTGAKIVVSNDLDEYSIRNLVRQDVPVDVFGVGTRLITAKDDPALGGVYKLLTVFSGDEAVHVMKVSNDMKKQTLPGEKQVYRCTDHRGVPVGDIIAGTGEAIDAGGCPGTAETEPLVSLCMKQGKTTRPPTSLSEIRRFSLEQHACFPDSVTRLTAPRAYTVTPSSGLIALQQRLADAHRGVSNVK